MAAGDYLGNGQPVRNDWYWHDGKWYWFDGSGMMVSNVWYKYKDHWYYLGADGAMVTGQQTINGKWYIMDDSGPDDCGAGDAYSGSGWGAEMAGVGGIRKNLSGNT